ncbi:MAG TPA: hypothetical protein VD997_11230 [Phycisphaerales bacterium]|nr:hypothetical protein [Phycisphaerales bacterium]
MTTLRTSPRSTTPAAPGAFGRRKWLRKRRGVAAVLAMMFLILFGSLSVAMAISSKGNITTAATHLHVSRAQSAAETGLSIAARRLSNASSRFVISRSNVDSSFGWNLWSGNLGALGQHAVLRPTTGRQDLSLPSGLAAAIAEDHAQDQDIVTEVGLSQVAVGNAPANTSSEYRTTYWVFTPAVAVEPRQTGSTTPPLAYTVTYAPLANGTDIRVIATGYDYAYSRAGQPVKRTISQDFRIAKRVKSAIISPSRIMIGKNVMISGDIGSRFTGIDYVNGNPLVLRSDFRNIDPMLDQKLDAFYTNLPQYDVDADNRLRVSHPVEANGIPSGTQDYDGDGQPDNAHDDVTGDGYVDEFDVFVRHFDRNNDGKVVLPFALTAGTPAANLSPEFVRVDGTGYDDDLGLLIDSSNPDRNKNGVFGFIDSNRNGRWDAGETMLDFDSSTNKYRDQVLGYRDGVIDKKDQYAKVTGQLSFRVDRSAWTTAQGALQPILRGPISPTDGNSPMQFSADDTVLPDLNVTVFGPAQSNLQLAADGAAFNQQVASQLGISTVQLQTYVETQPATATTPRYLRLDGDSNNDQLPDNWATAYFEKMPFNSPAFTDYYYRPVYENMVFKDVQIPMGTNALFRNCTFVGVTYIRCEQDNTHLLWGEYGKMVIPSGQTKPHPRFIREVYGDDLATEPNSDRPSSLSAVPGLVLMSKLQPLDQADLPQSVANVTQGYTDLPMPLIINSTRVVDTKKYSNNIRFHDCLFVGSITSDAPQGYTQARNKLQFTGSTRFVQQHPSAPDDPSLNPQQQDMADIKSSSMMVPNYSVDLGSYNSPNEQDLQLQGAIIAGVLDVRGNANINGALLLTFAPTLGSGPLRDALGLPAGNPAGFNTTIGYFGPTDGDEEALDPNNLPLVNGVRIAGWDVDGDGLVDLGADQPQPAGSTAIPFHGYGRIQLRFDPKMAIPSGIMLPMTIDPLPATYREGNS